MDPFLIITILAVTAASVLAYILSKNRGLSNKTRLLFFIFIIVFIIWTILNYFSLQPELSPYTLWIVRIIMVAALTHTCLIYLFAKNFPNNDFSLSKKLVVTVAIVYVIALLVSLSPLLFAKIIWQTNMPTTVSGPGVYVFGLATFFFIAAATVELIKKYRTSHDTIKKQLLYLLIGEVIMFSLLFFLHFVIVIWFGNYSFIPFGGLPVLFFIVLTTYAITRHRFLDIRVVLRKSLIIGSLLVVSLAIVIATLLFTKKIVSTYSNISDDILVLASMTILLLIFPKLKHSCQKLIDKYIFSDYVDLSAKIKEFEENAPKSTMMQGLAQSTASFIQKNFKVSDIHFLVYDHVSQKRFVSYYPTNQNIIVQADDPLPQFCRTTMRVVLKEELQLQAKQSELEKRALRRLDMLRAEVVVPFGEDGMCYGMLLLGRKIDQQAFSKSELNTLEQLAKTLTHLVPQIASIQISKNSS